MVVLFDDQLAMELGAGRACKEDVIDRAVGLMLRKKYGEEVQAGESLMTAHVNELWDESWINALQEAVQLGDAPPAHRPLVLERVVSKGIKP